MMVKSFFEDSMGPINGREKVTETRIALLNRLVQKHTADLTKYGLLPANAIAEALATFALQDFLFSVRVDGKDLGYLRISKGQVNVASSELHELNYQNCYIIVPGPISATQHRQIRDLLQHCQFIVLNTLAWKNQQKVLHRRLYEELRHKINADDDNIRIDALPSLLKTEIGVDIEIVERVRSGGADRDPGPIQFVRRRIKSNGEADRIELITDPALIRLIQREALNKATTLDVTEYFRSEYDRRGPIVMVPLCRSSASKSARAQLFLLRGTHAAPLRQHHIAAVEAVVTFFLEEVLYQRQRDFIFEMIERISIVATEPAKDVDEEFLKLLDIALARIVTDTAAYRCSYWHFDQKLDKIRVDRMATYERGRLQRNFHTATRHINANDVKRSSIAYVLAGAEGDGFLTINDCGFPKPDFRGRSLETIIRPSGETQSEFLAQVRDNAVPFGVILAESRLDSAFEADQWFIRSVSALLSEFLRTLQNRQDSFYVADRFSLFDADHDLDTFVSVNLRSEPEVQRTLRDFLRIGRTKEPATPVSGQYRVRDLIEEIKEDYIALTAQTRDEVFRRVHVDDVPLLHGSSQMQRALGYILKNLISNAFKYDEISKTTIGISLAPRSTPWVGLRRKLSNPDTVPRSEAVLRIDCIITPAFEEHIEQQIGRRSVVDATRGGRRGLYLVGLMVRQMAGAFHVHRSKDKRRTIMVIRLPVETFGEGR
jgi:two-component sensor histidine kinase